jgi:RNA polymerase sigma-70 factor (ECF subfamily)
MGSLVRLAARITGTQAEAEDVVQEAYIRAYRAIQAGRFDERSRVETWMHRIVVNAAIDHVRSRKPRVVADVALAAEPSDPSRAESVVALRELDDWLSGLPPEQRAAIVLKSVEGWTSAEIAQALGCSEGAVEQKLVRARNALRGHNGEGWQ